MPNNLFICALCKFKLNSEFHLLNSTFLYFIFFIGFIKQGIYSNEEVEEIRIQFKEGKRKALFTLIEI